MTGDSKGFGPLTASLGNEARRAFNLKNDIRGKSHDSSDNFCESRRLSSIRETKTGTRVIGLGCPQSLTGSSFPKS